MLVLQTLGTAAYLAFVLRVWRVSRAARLEVTALGGGFTPYVEDGLAAIDAYLSESSPP